MSQPNELRWIVEARKHIGLREIKGAEHNPEILQMWKDIKRGGIKDDETPWCAAFVGAMLERVGIQSTRFESARSYTSWGTALHDPAYGCIGQDANRNLLVLGGNQGDAVNIRAFPRSRVTGYRWPAGEPGPESYKLPLQNAQTSTSEA